MTSKNFILDIVREDSDDEHICDNTGIEQQLKKLVMIMAKDAARQTVSEGIV